jgi:hypothetical protein
MKNMPGIFSRFYKENPIEKIMNMTDEEITLAIDRYLDKYIKGWESRNKGKDLPDINLMTINDIRNIRTNVSKKPKISGRRSYD